MTDILIVGAGIAGCHTAYELSRDHEVYLVDQEGIAAGATGLSAGLVAPTMFYGDVPAVARHANAFFRDFNGTREFEFTERDRLDFVGQDDEQEMRDKANELADEGFPVSFLNAEQAAALYPEFDPDEFVGAVHYRDTGWVDPYSYAAALANEAKYRGATLVFDVTVENLLVDGNDGKRRVEGVKTGAGTYEADTVVLACGWRTDDLLPPGVRIPIRPYRTQVVVLEPDEPLSADFPLGRIRSKHLYFRPEHNGDLLVGGAHYPISNPERASQDADESFKLDIASYLPDLIDGFDTAGFVSEWAGVDAATPDARPIIDACGPDGLIIATGFNGLGIMISPVVGPTIRARVTNDDAPFPTDIFELNRFDAIPSEFDYISTSDI